MKKRSAYYVFEAWSGFECVRWRSGCQARTLRQRMAEEWINAQADRGYVHNEGELVASWTVGRGWFDIRDERLAFLAEG